MTGAGSGPRVGGLDARVVVRRPGHTLDVHLTVAPRETVAVVGPNGSGKTTLLRALAGLVPLSEGHVRYDDDVWEAAGPDRPHERTTVQERRVGVVFQSLLLFPHLSARDNVAYGPRSRGTSRAEARALAQELLEQLGVGELADRRASALSGGQAQRVAIARALATDPRLLMLDEPLASLDVAVAMSLRIELRRHLESFPGATLLVSHDALDALSLADRVVVLQDGRVAQDGTPDEVARQPRTAHVARLVGLNVLHGVSRGPRVTLSDGSTLVTTTAYDGPTDVTFSPAAVTLGVDAPTGSARNHWQGRVVSVVPQGLAVRVHLDALGGLIADVTVESATALGLVPGRVVHASVKATDVVVHGVPGTTPREASSTDAAPLA